MAHVALTAGAYQTRSLIAAAQSCINLYPEAMPQAEGEPAPVVHLPTPGLRLLATAPQTGWRGLYRATNGTLYGAVGSTLYAIDVAYAFTPLLPLAPGAAPVGMADNSVDLLVVDGSATGHFVDLATNSVNRVIDEAFYGADRVSLIDQFFVLNRPGTNQFYLSDAIARSFNPLYIAAKAGLDRLVSLAVIRREVWLFGERLTEVYAITGAPDFPLGIVSGGIDHGCAARYSVARTDGAVFWLSQDRDGQAVVMRGATYQGSRISTHALEAIFAGYGRIDDAIGYTRQQDGHTFYVLTFPAADATWTYDLATDKWHQWQSGTGRHRGACHVFANGKHLVGDHATGALYEMTPDVGTDNAQPIRRVRAFPHMIADSRRVSYVNLTLDMQAGTAKPGDPEPMVSVRWSDDRGATFGAPVLMGLGLAGDTAALPALWNLGHARDRVFEVSWDFAAPTALQGAWINTRTART